MFHDLITRTILGILGTIVALAILMPIAGFILLSIIPWKTGIYYIPKFRCTFRKNYAL